MDRKNKRVNDRYLTKILPAGLGFLKTTDSNASLFLDNSGLSCTVTLDAPASPCFGVQVPHLDDATLQHDMPPSTVIQVLSNRFGGLDVSTSCNYH